MSDRIKKIKIKQSDGTFSDYIPIGADAKNIDTTRGESVQSVIDKTARYYNSIAEMKLDDNIQVGDTCVTLGYYEVNDGGSGTYKIVDDSSLEDDGGSIHELNNGLKAKLIIKDNQINVKQFGAYGDGEHDDTNAIQNALNTKTKNIILFNETYLISHLIAYHEQSIYGKGFLTCLKSISNNSHDCILETDGDAGYCHFDNFRIEGNYSENTSNIIDGISLKRNSGTINGVFDSSHFLNKLYIQNCSGNGIYISNQNREVRLSNIKSINNLLNGFVLNCTDSIMEKCTSSTNRKNGIIAGGANNRIINNKVFANGAYGKYPDEKPAGILVSGKVNSIIGNESQENCYDGIVITGDYNIVSDNLINGNGSQNAYFSANYKESCGIKMFVDEDNYNKHCSFNTIQSNIILGNRTSGNQKYGVFISDLSSNMQNHPCFNDIKLISTNDRTEIDDDIIDMVNFYSDIDNISNNIVINGEQIIYNNIKKDLLEQSYNDYHDDDNFIFTISQDDNKIHFENNNLNNIILNKTNSRRYTIIPNTPGGKDVSLIIVKYKAKTNSHNVSIDARIGGAVYKEDSTSETDYILTNEPYISTSKSTEYMNCCSIIDMRKYPNRKFYNAIIGFFIYINQDISNETLEKIEGDIKDIEYVII